MRDVTSLPGTYIWNCCTQSDECDVTLTKPQCRSFFCRALMMSIVALSFAGSASGMTAFELKNVDARQCLPRNGLVEITVSFQCDPACAEEVECAFVATNGESGAALRVVHIERNGDDSHIGNIWTRRFVWNAAADIGAVRIGDVALTVKAEIPQPGVQLWEDGPYWAECNVGATKPEESGYYFWWGDTVGYRRDANHWISNEDSIRYFSFISGKCETYGKDNAQLQSEGYIDSTGNLAAAYDAARVHLGAQWRMPTIAEYSALTNYCTIMWTTLNGVKGQLVTGTGSYASKSLFFPAAGYGHGSLLSASDSRGYYWFSAPDSLDPTSAWGLDFTSDRMLTLSSNSRAYGQSVRAVRETGGLSGANVGATVHLTLDCQPLIVSVVAQQRQPKAGLVDITVTLQGEADEVANVECSFVATNSETVTEIPVSHITRNGDDSHMGNIWIRRFVWDAAADVGAVKIDDVALTVTAEIPPDGVQLWENGPYWAECNVGAAKPEECGYYFWWGDTIGYKRNGDNSGWISVKDSIPFSFNDGNCPTYGKSNFQLELLGYIDSTGSLVAEHDAATAHLGAPWRMPTDAEFAALIDNCTTIQTTTNGVTGQLVIGTGAYSTKSIFLPAAGRGVSTGIIGLGTFGQYWSSTPDSEVSARCLSVDYSNFEQRAVVRYDGLSVRPVRDVKSTTMEGMTTHLGLEYSPGVSVINIEAKQRDPRDGYVDVVVTLQCEGEEVANVLCAFAATDTETGREIPVSHIKRDGDDSHIGTIWTRRFVWNAVADVGAVKIDDVALTVTAEIPLPGVQLWEGGPYWAECNVGATNPEEYGYYFWWGDTVGYKRNGDNSGWISVKDSIPFSFNDGNCPTYGKSNFQLELLGYIDSTGSLVAEHDAATVQLGVPWRMPTDEELSALVLNCDTEWTMRNGVNGCLVKGKGSYSSKSIFLSAGSGGYDSYLYNLGTNGGYWSSVPNSDGLDVAWGLSFSLRSGNFVRSDCGRYYGRSVRPVRDFAGSVITGDVATTHLTLDCLPKIVNVVAQQRHPKNRLVDIAITFQCVAGDVEKVSCAFVADNIETGTEIPVSHITRNGDDSHNGNIWTRRFVWNAAADIGAVRIGDVALTVKAGIPQPGVQLWEDGPYWAECNVGSMKPEECGYYFWWGDTVGYKREGECWSATDGSKTDFSFNGTNCSTEGKDAAELFSKGYTDASGNLAGQFDAATAQLGAPWRMPTDADFAALIDNCTTMQATVNGVCGQLVIGTGAYSSKSIFLPAAGYGGGTVIKSPGTYGIYWSSTPHSEFNSGASGFLEFGLSTFRQGFGSRSGGLSVRPVRDCASANIWVGAFRTHLALDFRDCWKDVTFYVDGKIGSDTNSGESVSLPLKTIQAAVDVAKDGDTILVAAGTYRPFSSKNMAVTIRSFAGARKTFIDGSDLAQPRVELLDHANPTFISVNNKTNTVLVGFTVEHCEWIIGGTIRNCIVRNIDAHEGGAPINMSIVENCLVLNNVGCNGGAGDNCIFRNCTIVGNRATSFYHCVALNCVLENCIVYGNADNSSGTWEEWLRPMISDAGYREAYVYRENPQFVDAEAGDYRLSKNSPCIDVGNNFFVTSKMDLNGLDRVVNDRIDIGCCEYQHPIVEDGLVAWYKFNGNAKDSSGNENDGVVRGAQLTEDRNGNANGAYMFDGDDWIQIESSDSLNSVQGTDEMSFAAWLRTDSYDTWVPIFCKATTTDGDPLYDFKYTFGRYFEGYDADLIYLNSVPAVGVWTHVAVTINHGDIVIYQDGNEVGRGAGGAFNSTIPNDALCLGMDSVTYKEFLKGAMDDVRFYNRALTEQEVRVLHAGKIVEIALPAVDGDPEAIVTGDLASGFVVKPSEGKTAVEVTIPQGVDAAKVTVEVSVKVVSVKPNGAKVKIVSGGADITEFLNVPTADGNGVIDLTKATVKEEIVKETLDTAKGAVVELNAADSKLTTAPTRAGLFYQLREGETLGGMKDGDSKVGDGQPWSPEIKVKGGKSGFYSIGIGKGE